MHIRENFFRNYLSCKSNDLTRFFQPYYAKCVYSHLFHHFFCGASAVAAGAAMAAAAAADPAAFPDPPRLRRRDGFAEGAGAGLGAFFGAAVAADLFPAAFAALPEPCFGACPRVASAGREAVFPAGSMGVPGAGRVPCLRRGRDGREVAPASGCAGFLSLIHI